MTAELLVVGTLGVGGIAVVASGKRELIKRWLSWVGLVPLVFGALWLGPWGAAALAVLFGVIAVVEHARLTRLRAADRWVLVMVAVVLPVLAVLRPSSLAAALLVVPLVAAAPALLSADAIGGGSRAAYSSLGALWIPGALTGLVLLGDAALPLCAAVSLGDVAAWCGGKVVGRRGPFARRLSALSPSKTWGGVVGAAVGAALTLLVLQAFDLRLLVAVVAGGVLGDLLESMLKREAGVKDAGSWLPGFGGLLDRIDSLLVALPVAVVLTGALS